MNVRCVFKKFPWNAGLWLFILLGTNPPISAQKAGEEPPAAQIFFAPTIDLHQVEVIHFSEPGPVAVASKIKCGPGGDIFAVYSNNSYVDVWGNPIRKVSLSSRRITEYPIPAIPGYEKLSRAGFDVDANGILYALLLAHPQSATRSDASEKAKHVFLIVKYKEDGGIDSYFPLAELNGKKIQPTSLAMFANGNSLVSGTIRENSVTAGALDVFSAVFNQSGIYRAPIALMKLPADTEADNSSDKQASSTAHERQNAISLVSSLLSFSAADGNIYILNGSHLNVVSQSGSIEHEFLLMPPNGDLSPIQMAAAGTGYFFAFYDHISNGTPGENTQRHGMITVANAQTGEVAATYRISPLDADFSVAACAVSLNDFVFLGLDKQSNLEVVHYRPN